MPRKPAIAATLAAALAVALLASAVTVAVPGRRASAQTTSVSTTRRAPTRPPSTPFPRPTPTMRLPARTKPRQPVGRGRRFGPTAHGKVVYLTFDDGPDPTWTPQILAVLSRHGAKATFFELGEMVDEHPGLQQQVKAAGQAVGNHSVSHAMLTSLPSARRHQELTGGPHSHCFRPPYGATDATLRAEIRAAGMTQVLWTVDPRDWDRPGTSAIVHNVLRHARAGSVVLMHDGGGNRAETVAALDRILRTLKARGYSFPAMAC